MIDYSTFLGPLGTDLEIDLERDRIAEFAAATLDAHPEHRDPARARALGLPDVIAPPTLAFVLTLGTSRPLPFPLDGFLHVDQSLSFTRPLTAGERYQSRLSLTRARHRGGNGKGPDTWILSVEGELRDSSGQAISRSESRLLYRSTPGPENDGGEPSTPPLAESLRPAGDPDLGPVVRSLTLTREDVRTYARVSGDPNPIHWDDEIARRYGLSGVIAHGMLTMALLAQAAEDEARTKGRFVVALGCRFLLPVSPGEPVAVHLVKGSGTEELELTLTAGASPEIRVRGETTLREWPTLGPRSAEGRP